MGSRECGSHAKRMREILAVLRGYGPGTIVVSGGAPGIDSLGADCGRALALAVHEYPADWKTLGKRAGFVRNQTIVDNCDELHAWWDGKSRGTAHTIGLARKAGKPTFVHAIPRPAQLTGEGAA